VQGAQFGVAAKRRRLGVEAAFLIAVKSILLRILVCEATLDARCRKEDKHREKRKRLERFEQLIHQCANGVGVVQAILP